MVGIGGDIKDGSAIDVSFQLNPDKEKLTEISHKITVVEGKEFYWAEKGPGGIWDNHHFKVEPIDGNKTRFTQSDEIMKGLTWLLGGKLSKMYVEGYQAFNRSLKEEVGHRFALA